MARPKTEYVNLVKSQLTDAAYEGVCKYMDMNRVSESRAIADLLELIVCGTNGTMPTALVGVTSKASFEIIEVELPVADAAAIAIKSAQFGVSTKVYAGIQCLQAFCGILHPLVIAFHNRAKQKVIGTETKEDES